MLSSPGTVSRILWHFTGGPTWNVVENRQENEPKPTEDAYSALVNILKSPELRIGGYREVIQAILPRIQRLDPVTKDVIEEANVRRQISSAPVCCLADIPVIHLNYHAERYGKVAIGFHRDIVVGHGFNPVLYLMHDSPILESFYSGLYRIGATHDRQIEDRESADFAEIPPIRWKKSATDGKSSKPKSFVLKNRFFEMLSAMNELVERIDVATLKMRTLIAFIKTFSSEDIRHHLYRTRVAIDRALPLRLRPCAHDRHPTGGWLFRPPHFRS